MQVFSDLNASKYQVKLSVGLLIFHVSYADATLFGDPWNLAHSNLLHQMAEYRISIYGRKQSEWDQLASWIVNNELYSENVVWLVQVTFRHFWCIYRTYNEKFL
jgi:AMP deaminase